MFAIGDTVVYGSMGVCSICDIRKESFASGEKKLYYVLKPVSEQSTTVYHPVDGDESKLCLPISAEDAQALLEADCVSQVEWIANDILRKESFDAILKDRQHSRLIALINLLTQKKLEKAKEGKKMRASDEKILNEAQKIVLGEFSFVLNKSEDEILKKILKK